MGKHREKKTTESVDVGSWILDPHLGTLLDLWEWWRPGDRIENCFNGKVWKIMDQLLTIKDDH